MNEDAYMFKNETGIHVRTVGNIITCQTDVQKALIMSLRISRYPLSQYERSFSKIRRNIIHNGCLSKDFFDI